MPYDRAFSAIARFNAVMAKDIAMPAYLDPDWKPGPHTSMPSNAPVIITGRFRTGSTLLWQSFIRLKGFTAYYEPFNERQWFDPAKRGEAVDSSHRGVADYSSNYDGLEHLGQYFDVNWNVRQLAMGKDHDNDNMVQYVQGLIDAATARPVLQFNRIDFRTGFLKEKFPGSMFVHLTRNPRDTWLSTLRGTENDPAWNLLTYWSHCKFYLLNWYQDLVTAFPQLYRSAEQTHPYEVHYLIHRLSTLFSARDCAVFVQYEDMEQDLAGTMADLMRAIGEQDVDLSVLEGLLSPRKQRYDHGDNVSLYQEIEDKVETELKNWLGPND